MSREKFEKMMKEHVIDYYNEHTERSEIDSNDVNKYVSIINRKDTADFYRIELKLRKDTGYLFVAMCNKETKDIHFNVFKLSDYEKIPFVKE